MEKVVKDPEAERNLVRAINENEQRLTDLRYMLDSTHSKRNQYLGCKYKCENLKNWLRAAASLGIVAFGAAAISVGIINGHPTAGNIIFCAGLLSLGSLPIIYTVKTKYERHIIKNTNYKRLSMDEYKLRNAVQRREERKDSLRRELNHARGIVGASVVANETDKVIDLNQTLAKQK